MRLVMFTLNFILGIASIMGILFHLFSAQWGIAWLAAIPSIYFICNCIIAGGYDK